MNWPTAFAIVGVSVCVVGVLVCIVYALKTLPTPLLEGTACFLLLGALVGTLIRLIWR